jgi:hypothetical protein
MRNFREPINGQTILLSIDPAKNRDTVCGTTHTNGTGGP